MKIIPPPLLDKKFYRALSVSYDGKIERPAQLVTKFELDLFVMHNIIKGR